MMYSFPFSASVLLLSAVILLSSFSNNTTPLADTLSIVRSLPGLEWHGCAIDVTDPFDSNGIQSRDGIFGPGPDPGQDVAALIPRVFTPVVPGGRLQPNSRRPDEDTPDTPDTPKEPPSKTHKPGDQKKKRPTPNDPDKCDDEKPESRALSFEKRRITCLGIIKPFLQSRVTLIFFSFPPQMTRVDIFFFLQTRSAPSVFCIHYIFFIP